MNALAYALVIVAVLFVVIGTLTLLWLNSVLTQRQLEEPRYQLGVREAPRKATISVSELFRPASADDASVEGKVEIPPAGLAKAVATGQCVLLAGPWLKYVKTALSRELDTASVARSSTNSSAMRRVSSRQSQVSAARSIVRCACAIRPSWTVSFVFSDIQGNVVRDRPGSTRWPIR